MSLRLELASSPSSLPLFVGVTAEFVVYLKEGESLKHRRPTALQAALFLEDGTLAPDQSVLKASGLRISGRGVARVKLTVEESTASHKQRFKIRFCASGLNASVFSVPFECVRFQLVASLSGFETIKSAPNARSWYKDLGGKDKTLKLSLSLRSGQGMRASLVAGGSGAGMPVRLTLCYEPDGASCIPKDAPPLRTQSFLALRPQAGCAWRETAAQRIVRLDSKGRCEVPFRVTSVSSKHDNQNFVVRADPCLSSDPTYADVAPTITGAFKVCSKPSKPKNPAGRKRARASTTRGRGRGRAKRRRGSDASEPSGDATEGWPSAAPRSALDGISMDARDSGLVLTNEPASRREALGDLVRWVESAALKLGQMQALAEGRAPHGGPSVSLAALMGCWEMRVNAVVQHYLAEPLTSPAPATEVGSAEANSEAHSSGGSGLKAQHSMLALAADGGDVPPPPPPSGHPTFCRISSEEMAAAMRSSFGGGISLDGSDVPASVLLGRNNSMGIGLALGRLESIPSLARGLSGVGLGLVRGVSGGSAAGVVGQAAGSSATSSGAAAMGLMRMAGGSSIDSGPPAAGPELGRAGSGNSDGSTRSNGGDDGASLVDAPSAPKLRRRSSRTRR
jgi:hypothetical protein